MQSAPVAGGTTPLLGHFSWLPSGVGVHNLRARVITATEASSESDVVWVFTQEPVYGPEVIAQSEPDVIPVLASVGVGVGEPPTDEEVVELPLPPEYTPPNPPSPDSPVQPAAPWSPSPGGFIDWIVPSPSIPNAPALTGAVNDCTVMLMIQDLSDDELGFHVYRTKLPENQQNSPTFTLAGQPNLGWLSLDDEIMQAGVYSYVAQAFKAEGTSGLSNPITLNVSAPGCAQPQLPPLVFVKPITLTLPEAAQQTYCYVSIGDLLWTRYPEIGFLQPGESNVIEFHPDVSDLFVEVIGAPIPQTNNEKSYWECWGWAGGSLVMIGEFEFELIPAPEEQTVLDASNVSELVFQYAPIDSPTYDLDFDDLQEFDFDDLLDVLEPKVPHTDLLAPRLNYSTETSDCTNNLPGNVQPDFQTPTCHPGHSGSNVDEHPHAYLTWDLNDKENCSSPGNCIDPTGDVFWAYAVVDSGYHLYDLDVSDTVPVNTFHGFDNGLHIAPPKGCGMFRAYEVRTFVHLDNFVIYESMSPNAVRLFYEPCAPNAPFEIDITFTKMRFGHVDDGESDPQDIEIYGVMSAHAPAGKDGYIGLGSDLDKSYCASSEIIDGDISAIIDWGCPIPVVDGEYNLAHWKLWCSGPTVGSCDSGFEFGNNTATLSTVEGENMLLISIHLVDNDSASANDTVCDISGWLTKDLDIHWSHISGTTYSGYQGDNGSASCRVWWTLTVKP